MAARKIPIAEAVGMIEKTLGKAFPGVEFDVIAEGTNPKAMEIIVRWECGPTVDDVQTIVNRYRSSDYDGSAASAPRKVWLMPDGTIAGVAYRPEIQGSTARAGNYVGGLKRVSTPKSHLDAEKVQFVGISHVWYVHDGELTRMRREVGK